jgi:hypothetical protein
MLIVCFPAFTKEIKHEFSIGAGAFSRPYLKDAVEIEKIWLSDDGMLHDRSYSGTFHISYNYFFNKHRSIGFSYMFEQQKYIYSNSNNPSDRLRTFYTHYYHSTMLRYTEYWIQAPFISLYSSLGFGVNYTRIKNTLDEHLPFVQLNENKNTLAYQITPIGIRIGKRIGGYAEVGYGYKGIVCGGLSYRF